MLPPDAPFGTGRQRPTLAFSPDSTMVVYPSLAQGRPRLFKRRLADGQTTTIDGTGGGEHPFFSPDGQWLGYVDEGRIWKMRVDGGTPIVVATLPSVAGASWGDDGYIVAGRDQESGLWRVPAAGGTPEQLTEVTDEDGSNDHRWPQALPGGRGVLFSVSTGPEDSARIVVLDARTGTRKDLVKGSASARYVPTGHLVYARSGELQAAPFDLDRLEVTGPATRVAAGVEEDTDGEPEYAMSRSRRPGLRARLVGRPAIHAGVSRLPRPRPGHRVSTLCRSTFRGSRRTAVAWPSPWGAPRTTCGCTTSSAAWPHESPTAATTTPSGRPTVTW